MEIIKSLENQKVKYWFKLNQKKYRDLENVFLIEGDHLVNEALKTNLVKEIITSDEAYESNLPVYLVTPQILNKLTNLKSTPTIMAVVKKLEEKPIASPVLILDNIQDPGNLGTIIRSSASFNFKTICLSLNTVDLYNSKTIKATEGNLFKVNVLKDDLTKAINKLKEDNYIIYGTDVTNGTLLKEVKPEKDFAVVMGNEGNGVSADILKLCDQNIYIPISSYVESLNVAVATSIILYELGDLND